MWGYSPVNTEPHPSRSGKILINTLIIPLNNPRDITPYPDRDNPNNPPKIDE